MTDNNIVPTTERQRFIILDAMRGLALLGICLANLPEFSLWTFMSSEEQAAMPTANADNVVRFLQYMIVDAKFYGIFSILFGIGFSIILSHAMESGSKGVRLFYRRMSALLFIAVLHLMCVWSGDILCLYAIVGMLLPLFMRMSDKTLWSIAAACIFIPVGIDLWQELSGVSISAPIVAAWWAKANSYGITEDNFASWLRDAKTYMPVHQFLMQGAIERMYEFVDGHRLLKVLGLFLIGYQMGRSKLYARLNEYRQRIDRVMLLCFAIGLPTSALYAYSATSGHPWGLTMHSLLYAVSALPMSLAYMAVMVLISIKSPDNICLRLLAKPGRMALTNYIGQSLLGIILYYGIGLGLGTTMGLWQVELTAIIIFIIQIVLSNIWMRHFMYGPLEWLWRMMTYGRRLKLLK